MPEKQKISVLFDEKVKSLNVVIVMCLNSIINAIYL